VGHPGAVAIVPVVDEHVVLIRQYRSAVDGPLLEIPAGKIDVPGEAPEKTARRELQEEVGFDAGSLRHLASIYTTPGFSDEVIHLYVASDLRRVAAVPHGAEEEAAQIVRVPIAKLRGLMTSGEICDAKTLVGLGMFLLERA
jgi:ADP-ribose pyrophosphatase